MSRTHTRLVPGHLEASPRALVLLVGDVLVLLAFISVGLLSHSIEPWRLPDHTLRTLTPFLLAWLVVAPLVGLYGRRTLTSYRTTASRVTAGWLLASLLGGAIRSTAHFPGGAPLDFLLVNIAFGLLFFLPWRLLVAGVTRRSVG